jgi:hypothetical protein
MGSTIIEQDFPYDILRRGSRDAEKHNKRVNDAVRKQLKDIISQQDIITSEGNKKIKVRLKYLDQFRFIHNRDRTDVVGRDNYDELDDGEILYRPQQGEKAGPKAGDKDGGELFEAEYTVEELTDMMIEELELPDLDETKKNEIVSSVLEYTDRRKKQGVESCIDKKRTILSHIRRKNALREQKKIAYTKDDLVYRTWNVSEEKHSNAVIFLMMDRSASMWEDKIYTVKAFYFWVVQFLKRKYDRVEIKFIAHDFHARELTEKEFFTISDSGGTRVSSAYEMCRDMIKHNYPSNRWNIYCFHSSDGDTWGDEPQCMEIVKEIMGLGGNLFAYAEINIDSWRDEDSRLLAYFRELAEEEDGVIVSVIEQTSDVLSALQTFLQHSHRRSLERM